MKLNCLIPLLCLPFAALAQVIDIPDANFKAKLISGSNVAFNTDGSNFVSDADTNNDGEIQISEAAAVTGMDLRTTPANTNGNLMSLEGLQYFTNLKQLRCSGNSLTTLDVSMLPLLEYLQCGNNQLSSLNVTGLGQLKFLWCNDNVLNILNTTGMNSLEELHCRSNNLSSLDFENLPAIKKLNIGDNDFSVLDVTGLSELEIFLCSGNPLTQLNVTGLSSLLELAASGTLLTGLDLTGLGNMTYLELNSSQIASIDLSPVPSLMYFSIGNNPITSINLANTPALTYLFIDATLISELDCSQTAVAQISANNNPNLVSINVQNGVHSTSDPDMLFYAFNFTDLPSLTQICLDNHEQINLAYTDYNPNGDVQLFTGENCDVEIFLGTDEFSSPTIQLYPNPASHAFNVQAAGDNVGKVEIYNTLGQLLKTVTISGTNSIDITALSAGTYLVKIESGGKTTTKRLLKI